MLSHCLDIDWEYPNYDQTRPQDKDNLSLLMRDLRSVLGWGYHLSAAVGVGAWRTDLSYDLWTIASYSDTINLMTYDMHGGWQSITGIHGAMFRGPHDHTDQNMEASINLALARGVPREKLVVGIPTYGIGFTLVDAGNNGVGAPASSGGHYYPYHNICAKVNSGSWNNRFEDAQQVPYTFLGTEWIGYDDLRSVSAKASFIVSALTRC